MDVNADKTNLDTEKQDIDAVRKINKEADDKAFSGNAIAGTTQFVNQALGGAPELISKILLPKVREDILKKQSEYPAANIAGGVAGTLTGAFVDPYLKIAQLASKAPKISVAASKFADFLSGLNDTKTWGKAAKQAAIRSGASGLVDLATNENPEQAAINAGLGLAGGTLAGKLLGKNAQNAMIAKAEDLKEYPLNYKLGKVGIQPGDITSGIMEERRVANKALGDKQKRIEQLFNLEDVKALIKDEPKLDRVSTTEKKLFLDPAKEIIGNTIDHFSLENPSAFSKLLAEQPVEKIKEMVKAANKDISEKDLNRVVEILSKAGFRGMMSDIPEAIKVGTEIAGKIKEKAVPFVVGATLGAGAGGAASIPEVLNGTYEPDKVIGGALTGLGLAAAPSAVPFILRKGAGVGSGAIDVVTKAPGGVTGVASRLGSIFPSSINATEKLDKSLSTEKTTDTPKEENMVPWNDFFSDRIDKKYQEYKKNFPKGMGQEEWEKTYIRDKLPTDENGEIDLSPEAFALSTTGLLTPEESENILKNYKIKKQIANLDLNHLLKEPSFLSGIAPNKVIKYKEDELLRTLLAPKPGSVVSPQSRIQYNKDLDMIRRSGLSQKDKEKEFKKLLAERYGYNPKSLSEMGLGD